MTRADQNDRILASHPSIIDTVPPYIVAEMQMMKERMDFMMNTLKRWVFSDLDDLVYRTNSPFIAFVTSFPLPPNFRMSQVENYDGSKDPPGSLGVFQDLDAPSRGARRDHVQGFPYHAEGTRKDLVQQVDAQLH